MLRFIVKIAFSLSIVVFSYSQDTINFKLYDSLKTKTEDSHKNVGLVDKNLWDSTYHPDPDNFDVRLFRSINNSRSYTKTQVLKTTDNSMLPVGVLLPSSLMIYGRTEEKTYDENTGYLLAASEMTSILLVFGTKMIIKRERPLNALSNVHSDGTPVLDVYSFPSGHASTTFNIATMFTLRYPKYPQVYLPMFAYALVVSYGRPYFGMHYPSDLLAGALVGSGSAILIYSLRKELFNFKNQVLGEDKNDDGSINAGVLSFFAGSFALSAIFDNLVFRKDTGKRLFISPWMDGKRGGMNVKWKL